MNPTSITINPNLPGTYPVNSVAGIIQNFYFFALAIAGILAFGAIVWGGIKYATSRGNPSAESEGKSWITNALLGLLLLAGAWIILYTVNPAILSLQIPGLPQLTGVTIPPTGGGPPVISGLQGPACQPPNSGPCTVTNLQQSCLASNAQLFAGICQDESGGRASALSGTDHCINSSGGTITLGNRQYASGALVPSSVGLFQISITISGRYQVYGRDCSNAFHGQASHCPSSHAPCTSSDGTACQVVDQALYTACVSAAQDAAANIAVACRLSNNGAHSRPDWNADGRSCGF